MSVAVHVRDALKQTIPNPPPKHTMSVPNPEVRLSEATLAKLPAEVQVPTYRREHLTLSIVHIGVGGFHRAHQAVYLENLLNARGTSWGECGVGLLPQDARMKEALHSQQNLYTVFTRGKDVQSAQVVGAITKYLYATESAEAVLEQIAGPETRIVSLTATEGGYCLNEGSGELDAGHPDIVHDLENRQSPRGVLGYLVEALNRRRQRGLLPFTILSCDNLPGNGDVTRKAVLSFASLRAESLCSWIETNVTFPNGMVDGITPVTRESDREALRDIFGIEDAWPVVTEPFRQWVLEDRFCNGRPKWEDAGVQFTGHVAPYEKMKLRLLNAGHSALGYLGVLRGFEFVHEAAADPTLREFLRQFLNDVTPLIPELPGFDVEQYKQTLLERFSNPAIRDQISRICSDGSAKLPKFILPSIRELLEKGRSTERLSLVIAGWLIYVGGEDERGRSIEVLDARKAELSARVSVAGDNPAVLLAMRDLFGSLVDQETWLTEVHRLLRALRQRSVTEVLKSWP